ncbi:hypothetical protein DASC09_008760 [Saccharomycopsis crataegensis]|uniref:Arginase n=1 Tax=Saccharomycopsis crataegensis TaxID=43959 RepID=A0AAV5QFV8_9ASCO|nr:hypothetical protein DASC09_008760 [Saccharomycopsis crataegensis]
MAAKNSLRLVYPQWQGGNSPLYHFGSQLLNFLAPPTKGPVEVVGVETPEEAKEYEVKDKIFAKDQILVQHNNAKAAIAKHDPDSLVILGGDCSMDLVPFSYLLQKYDDLAILWVDAHPDIMTAEHYQNSHAHVLGNLMGHGDKDLVKLVPKVVPHEKVIYAGLQKTSDFETEFIKKYNIKHANDKELAENSDVIIKYLKETGAKHVAIHLDLDVLDPTLYRDLLPCSTISSHVWDEVPFGKMKLAEVSRLLNDVSKVVEIVGLGIAEHHPYDAYNLRNLLSSLPLIGEPETNTFKAV